MSFATLIVDASHDPKVLAGGYGAWIRTEGWERGETFGGAVIGALNSHECELQGIAHALEYVRKNFQFETLVLQCDNQRALGLLLSIPNTRRARVTAGGSSFQSQSYPSPYEKKALKVCADSRFTLWLRHVKGHSEGTGRNWVNEQCDRIAKQHMRRERTRLQGIVT